MDSAGINLKKIQLIVNQNIDHFLALVEREGERQINYIVGRLQTSVLLE